VHRTAADGNGRTVMLGTLMLALVVILFALIMGASGLAPSFAAPHGAKLIRKPPAVALFSVFVFLGAITLGKNVSLTLGRDLLPRTVLTSGVATVILSAAALSLFLATVLKIPQSTSQVTVGAVVGAGVYFAHLNCATLFFVILPAWILLPLLSYLLTHALYRGIYPPRQSNLRLYQKIFAHEKKMRICSLLVSCYVAFAIGGNNVANAAGPLSGAGVLSVAHGLILIAPLFGLGAWLMGDGPLETAGSEIVPLGAVSSSLVCFSTATLLIIASLIGVPQSLVQLNIFSIFAIRCLKDGDSRLLDHRIARKALAIWVLTPLLAAAVSYALLGIF
jgi:sulfate permease